MNVLRRDALYQIGIGGLISITPRGLMRFWADRAGQADTTARDEPWMERIRSAPFRMVFDAAEVGAGAVFSNAASYLSGTRQDAGPHDVVLPVVVLRHAAVALALDDFAWCRYPVGKLVGSRESRTIQDATQNPFLCERPGLPHGVERGETIAALTPDVLFLVCDSALASIAAILARNGQESTDHVLADLRQHLLPGMLRQPTGILALARAQRAGCSYIKSS